MFDLCHENFEKYLTASCYVVKKGQSSKNYFNEFVFDELENIDSLFEQIKKHGDDLDNKDAFKELIQSLRIFSYEDDDLNKESTSGLLFDHIFGDVSLGGKNYFLINNGWYRIKNDFVKGLNDFCNNFLRNNYNDELNKKWRYNGDTGKIEDEDTYNKSYIEDDNTLVLHKVTYENIEVCDVLKWNDKGIYLYFIKTSFGNTMRDLCSQVFISADRIARDINSSGTFIAGIYEKMKNINSEDEYFGPISQQIQNKKISKDDFTKLFRKNRFFVVSILDTGKEERNMKDGFEKFNSNIAKFSFQELSRSMKGIDERLEITQIFKS
jgi:uncharacterized protein (TIGR04141 family)